MRRGPRPMIAIIVALVVIGFVAVDRATTARAAGAPAVKLTPIAPLELGTAIAPRPGDTGIYITEQTGTVRVVRGGKLSARPLLDITADVSQNGGEQGLLGLAFSPDGDHLYLDYTDRAGNTQIVEYAMRGRTIVAASRRVVLSVDQPQANHNGGQLAFGPDGMLYIALGDGGGAGDSGHRPRGGRQRAVARHAVGQDPPHRPVAPGHIVIHGAARQPVRRATRGAAGDLGLRVTEPVALHLRRPHR